jgi:glyceraldehyde 3-phosphate dehydrogenase
MSIRVGINGFGRIGRNYLRAAAQHGDDLEIVGINDITDVETLAHLLRHDTVHGAFPGSVEAGGDGLIIDGREVVVSSEREPASLPWKDLGAELVLESTGLFTERAKAAGHLDAGARKVIISAPGKNEDVTVVMGANESAYDPARHDVISNGSCTTNSVVPMAKVLEDAFGIESGFMTTVHAYTNDQGSQDQPHKDLRRARAAASNIIPTSTGAARAAALAMPQLEGRLDGMAMRVPVIDGSITDLVVTLKRAASSEEVNGAFQTAANGELSGIIDYATEPLVSSDIVGNPASCVFDSLATMANGTSVKALGWYDNEWGYSCRLVDLTAYVGTHLG